MSDLNTNEQMLDMYLFETFQNIEQLENCILESEKTNGYSQTAINEIFRIMHTIKGSSAMMLFNNITSLAHIMEDLFYYIREQKPQVIETDQLNDLLLEGVDFIKIELEKIKIHDHEEGDCSALVEKIKEFIINMKMLNNGKDVVSERTASSEKIQYYIIPDKPVNPIHSNYFKAIVFFEEGCEMENIRAYTIIHNLMQDAEEITYVPSDIMESENSLPYIREKGFTVGFKTDKSLKEMQDFFEKVIFLKTYDLVKLEDEKEFKNISSAKENTLPEHPVKVPVTKKAQEADAKERDSYASSSNQNIISVNIAKLDKLMDLVGEMVISEALVTQNPDLEGLELENFQKAARQHHKIISEIQDLVMSVRMVPLAATFHKMHRIVRDMNKHLNKETTLILKGEETEVDKNIIEHISDPLMHLVRNSIDHGIESGEEREEKGKERTGRITIEAKNFGSDVIIYVKDDGNGLDRDRILSKAREAGLIYKADNDLTDREIFNTILLPGFSTKDDVTEYSGRGVGMDVVTKNIEVIGGTVSIDSIKGKGTEIMLKIPLTLAIIDGMNIRVGDSRYTIPITSIIESFRPATNNVIIDPDCNEMIMVRGRCYNILRLHQIYGVKTEIIDFSDGILIMVEQDGKACCLFADELLGQQQVVVKTLPEYIVNMKKIHGISGCTLLGDGSISLIINISSLIN